MVPIAARNESIYILLLLCWSRASRRPITRGQITDVVRRLRGTRSEPVGERARARFRCRVPVEGCGGGPIDRLGARGRGCEQRNRRENRLIHSRSVNTPRPSISSRPRGRLRTHTTRFFVSFLIITILLLLSSLVPIHYCKIL